MYDPLQPPRRTRTSVAGLLVVVIFAAVLLTWLQSASTGLYGYDGYFHIRYAEVLRSEGVSRSFPWWQETFLKDSYADKDFLYHLLLIPFTFGDLASGGRWAAALLGAVAIGVFYVSATRLAVPWPSIWPLILLASSTAFLYRLGFTRPAIMAVALAVAGTSAILLGNKKWAFAMAALYPHMHISFHLLPCVALLHEFHLFRAGQEDRKFTIARWTMGGAAAGIVLSPYFPNNLNLWWVQNIKVLSLAWTGPGDLGMGLEIRPGSSDQLLKYNIGAFLILAAGVYLLAKVRGRVSPQAITLLVISSGFLGLSMMSRRFIEFWVPFNVLFAAVATRDYLRSRTPGENQTRPDAALSRKTEWILGSIGAVVLGAFFYYNAQSARRVVEADRGPTYAGAAEWMSANVPSREVIFQMDWDDFPQLFFFNPQHYYLLGLDPAFMYVTDSERFRLWKDITHANISEIYTPIRETFGSRWVFGIPEAEDFRNLAMRDPRFVNRYEDEHALVWFLADGYSFVDDWKLTGWFPNQARQHFNTPLGPEPRSDPGNSSPAAIGPAAAGMLTENTEPFVDLSAKLTLPYTILEACGIAETELFSAAARPVVFGISTDDEYRIYLNGVEVAAHSRLRSPPPGTPGGVPVSLDNLVPSPPEGTEAKHEVQLEEGANSVLIKVCKVGGDFGFFFRAYDSDGQPISHQVPPVAPGE